MTRRAPLPDDAPCVPVKTFLRIGTYRQLTAHAAARGMTLPELLSKLADASLQPLKPQKRQKTPRRSAAEHDAEIRAMNAKGMNDSEIGRALGFVPSTIAARREAMGLPKRSAQGRKKKEVPL